MVDFWTLLPPDAAEEASTSWEDVTAEAEEAGIATVIIVVVPAGMVGVDAEVCVTVTVRIQEVEDP